MRLRKLFSRKQKAKDQKCLWPLTLRQSPKQLPSNNEYQTQHPHRYNLPLPSPVIPSTAETPPFPDTHPHRTPQIRHDTHQFRRRDVREGNEDQLPQFQQYHPHLFMQQQDPAPLPTSIFCTRHRSRYRDQPVAAYESGEIPGPISEYLPQDPRPTGPDLIDNLTILCRILIFSFSLATGIFVAVTCSAIWILAKLSTSLEPCKIVPQEEENQEVDGEINRISNPQFTHIPTEATHWRVMAWAYEQGFQESRGQEYVSQQDYGQASGCIAEPVPQNLACGAAREAWAIYAACPNCHV